MNDRKPWIVDNDIYDAVQAVTDAFTAMLQDEWPASGEPTEQNQGVWRDKDIYLSLDPQKLSDEYDRIYKAAFAVGDNLQAVKYLDETRDHLVSWTGLAAEAFKGQLSMMKEFCEEQQTRILRGLLGVAAVYAVAVEGRASFHALLRAAEAAAINVFHERQERDTQLKWALLFDLAGGIVGRDPKSLLGSAAVTMVEMGKDVTNAVIEGDDADQVMASYRREADLLNQSFGNALDRVTRDLGTQTNDATKGSDMYAPLPGYCDVDSPDFRYEHFRDTVHDPGPIGPQVEEERQKYVEEKRSHGGDIDRRLNPRDKGAI